MQNPHIEYDIGHFYTPLSVDEMAKLNDYVQQIIDAGVTKYPPPFISFQGQSEEQFEALWLLSDQFNFGENNTESET
uniref:Uncharacterized protein n=1 Tax=Panagrolaimus sp. ES5 TaxID=591445 RepID=A0AC34FBB2_9BILA